MDIADFKTRRKEINRKAYLKRKERLLNEQKAIINNYIINNEADVEDVIEPPKVISKTEQKTIYNNRYKQKKKLAEIKHIKAELYDSIKAEVLNTIIKEASFSDIMENIRNQLRAEVYEQVKTEVRKELQDKYMTESKNKLKKFKEFKEFKEFKNK
jgi:hypothetical protein